MNIFKKKFFSVFILIKHLVPLIFNFFRIFFSDFLTDDLACHEENGNQQKYLGVCRLPGEGFIVKKKETKTLFFLKNLFIN